MNVRVSSQRPKPPSNASENECPTDRRTRRSTGRTENVVVVICMRMTLENINRRIRHRDTGDTIDIRPLNINAVVGNEVYRTSDTRP